MSQRINLDPRTAAGAVLGVLGLVFAATPAAALASGDPVAGKALYQAKCGGCHSLDTNRIGPAHRGVIGRRVATAPGFAYSPAIKKLAGVWTPDRVDMWLQGPQKVAPGTKMFLVVSDTVQRADIIAFLAANSSTSTAR